MKQINQIRKLIDEFYDGVLTPNEIEQLKDVLMNTKELPADLLVDRDLILSLGAIDDTIIEIPEGLRQRLSHVIDTKSSVYSKLKNSYSIWSIAASVLVLLSVGCFLLQQPSINNSGNIIVVTDPQEAEIYARKALGLLASNVNEANDETILGINNALNDILK